MSWLVAAAAAYEAYDSWSDSADAKSDELRAWADNPNMVPAPNLPVIPHFWRKTEDGWIYVSHNNIRLWMVAETYLPRTKTETTFPDGKVRFSTIQATWEIWKVQPPEFQMIMKETELDYQIGRNYAVGSSLFGMPRFAMNPIPNGTPIAMPAESLPIARALGAIDWAPKGLQPLNTATQGKAVSLGTTLVIGTAITATSAAAIWYFLRRRNR